MTMMKEKFSSVADMPAGETAPGHVDPLGRRPWTPEAVDAVWRLRQAGIPIATLASAARVSDRVIAQVLERAARERGVGFVSDG